jgi:hypothetical protein
LGLRSPVVGAQMTNAPRQWARPMPTPPHCPCGGRSWPLCAVTALICGGQHVRQDPTDLPPSCTQAGSTPSQEAEAGAMSKLVVGVSQCLLKTRVYGHYCRAVSRDRPEAHVTGLGPGHRKAGLQYLYIIHMYIHIYIYIYFTCIHSFLSGKY